MVLVDDTSFFSSSFVIDARMDGSIVRLRLYGYLPRLEIAFLIQLNLAKQLGPHIIDYADDLVGFNGRSVAHVFLFIHPNLPFSHDRCHVVTAVLIGDISYLPQFSSVGYDDHDRPFTFQDCRRILIISSPPSTCVHLLGGRV